jgi:hypothetical protein
MRCLLGVTIAGALLLLPGLAGAYPQPEMEATLRSLETARQQIVVADRLHDHGGHSEAATNLIDQAIREVREGIRYRNEHPR